MRVIGVGVTSQETADAGEASLLESNGNQPSFASAFLAIGAQPANHHDGLTLDCFPQAEAHGAEPSGRVVRMHKTVPRTTTTTESKAMIRESAVEWASQVASGAKWSSQPALSPVAASTALAQEAPSSVHLAGVRHEGLPDDPAGSDATTAKSEPLFTRLSAASVKSNDIAEPTNSFPKLGGDRDHHPKEQASSVTAERQDPKMNRSSLQSGMQNVAQDPTDGQSEDLSERNVTAADPGNSHMTRIIEERALPDSRNSDAATVPDDSVSTEPAINDHSEAEPVVTRTVENAVSAAVPPAVLSAAAQPKRSEGQPFRLSSSELSRRPIPGPASATSGSSFPETFAGLTKVKGNAESPISDKSATWGALSDKGSPIQHTVTDPVHALEDAMRGELRVRVQTETFGKVTIQTNAGGGQLAAQLSIENAKQSTALAAHLPGVEQRIGEKYGLEASVLLARNGESGTPMGGSAAGSRGGDSHRRHDRYQVAASQSSPSVERDEGAGMDLAILSPRNIASTSRLDVTA